MTIKIGDSLPVSTIMVMGTNGPEKQTTTDLFAGKKVGFFALPGAYTPTCSAQHLPGYITHAADLRAKGIDTIMCLSVNDVFVMDAWGKMHGANDDVMMLADGNGDFTKAVGLTMDGRGFLMGERSQRYSMIVDDGKITALYIEAAGEFEISSAGHMLDNL